MKNNRNWENNRMNKKENRSNSNWTNSNNLNSQNKNFGQPRRDNKHFSNNRGENNYMNKKLLGNKRNFNHPNDDFNQKRPYQTFNKSNNNNINSQEMNNSGNNSNNRYYYNIFEDPRFNQNKLSKFNSENFSSQDYLPIKAFQKKILDKVSKNRITIVSGYTGCGKSTQIPQYIYRLNPNYKILMTQPRRIAAVSIAKRLAEEMGEKNVGKLIGFHVSMNPNFSNETKILVETTGIFLEEIIHKNLDYTHIIIDEVHERDIYIDLVLALIKWYFEQNPESKIKIILMSATISEEKFADYLKNTNGGEIPIIKIEESPHQIFEFSLDSIYLNIKNDPIISDKLKEEIILGSCIFGNMMLDDPHFIKELFPVCASIIVKISEENKNNKNGILIFLPGLGEIHELLEYLQNFFEFKKNNFEFLILHSQIADSDQDKIFRISEKRKIILATNIAESSITISNVDFVIDFCLVKQTRYDPNQNSSFLELKWCSKANCSQRKGRIGRVNTGFYFQLITSELYESLEEFPIPEILRISLEIPILKLKIHEPNKEPNDILLRTINPPEEEIILRTIFKLEKMGALIKGKVLKDDYKSLSMKKKVNYKSGVITTIGKIFAELPIDIKYSRLIMISYALGEIELGITLAAILSQERPIFLSSEKINRYKIYESKKLYSLGKECDFITCYTAYKNWYSKQGYLLLNKKVKFDTQLKYIEPEKYKDILNFTKENVLDIKILKEVMRVENDIKRRLTKFGIYCTNIDSNNETKKAVNFEIEENVLKLKIILTGTFYNQIYIPEFINTKNIAMDLFNSKEDNKKEVKTVRMQGISMEKAKKIGEIFNAMIKPDEIVNMDYDESDKYRIEFSSVEALKKILFITSTNTNRRNNELRNFCFKNNIEANDNEINNINETNNSNDEDVSLIQIDRDLEYYYRLDYFDPNLEEDVHQYKDSINYIQVISSWKQLKECKLITDTFHGKLSKNGFYYKYSKYSSVLPTIENFDKLVMLIFAPKYELIGKKDPKTGKYLNYQGFQGHEFSGLNTFTNYVKKEDNFIYEKMFLVKFDYLVTNYHLFLINEIRVLLNDIMKFKFVSSKNKKSKSELNGELDELTKEEFDEIYLNYKKKTHNIIEKIKHLLNLEKIKNIPDENYQDLFDYLNQVKYGNKKIINLNKINENDKSPNNIKEEEKTENIDDQNSINDNTYFNEEEEEDESSQKTQPSKAQLSYIGYINTINDLQKIVKKDDFLQLHEPLPIEEDFRFTDNDTLKELISRNYKIRNLYNDFLTDLDRIEKLTMRSSGSLVCARCKVEVSQLGKDIPIMTRAEIGEHKIEKSWLYDNLKEIYKIKKDGKKKKKYDIDDKDIQLFIKKLEENNIKYDNICCCVNKKHVIGYALNGEKYIFFGSELGVKYADLTYEKIITKESFINDFTEFKEKSEKIIEYKNTDEFKSKIVCKLCNFSVKEDLLEFDRHLKSNEHKIKLGELRKEFA